VLEEKACPRAQLGPLGTFLRDSLQKRNGMLGIQHLFKLLRTDVVQALPNHFHRFDVATLANVNSVMDVEKGLQVRVDGIFAIGDEAGGRIQGFCFDGCRDVGEGYEIAW